MGILKKGLGPSNSFGHRNQKDMNHRTQVLNGAAEKLDLIGEIFLPMPHRCPEWGGQVKENRLGICYCGGVRSPEWEL